MNYLSLFSGIEAVSVAWESLGCKPVAFSEIDPFCCEVLARRYPAVPNLGDIDGITESDIRALGKIDLVVFGSPCQDLSVAGKRAGLAGEKSGLFRAAIRVIRWCRSCCGCRYALWENVPGTFSSQQGRDFSEVLQLFTGQPQPVPSKGWQTSGVAYGRESLCEWRVLDAQYFGVPQRRRRLFAVVDFGDWRGRKSVLFESEGVCGNFAESGKAAEETAGTLEARTAAGGFPGTDGACANHVVVRPYDMQRMGQYGASSLKQRDYKDATDLVVLPIHDQATRFDGKRADKQDGKGNGLGIGENGHPMNTLTRGDKHAVYVEREMVVRRLTPVECERLQGFADNWTAIPWRGKPTSECPATPRYRCIGNSMAVPVMRWIGERILQEVAHGI